MPQQSGLQSLAPVQIPGSERLYRQVLNARRKLYGEEHPDTAMSYGSLGVNLDELGQNALAEPLLAKHSTLSSGSSVTTTDKPPSPSITWR